MGCLARRPPRVGPNEADVRVRIGPRIIALGRLDANWSIRGRSPGPGLEGEGAASDGPRLDGKPHGSVSSHCRVGPRARPVPTAGAGARSAGHLRGARRGSALGGPPRRTGRSVRHAPGAGLARRLRDRAADVDDGSDIRRCGKEHWWASHQCHPPPAPPGIPRMSLVGEAHHPLGCLEGK